MEQEGRGAIFGDGGWAWLLSKYCLRIICLSESPPLCTAFHNLGGLSVRHVTTGILQGKLSVVLTVADQTNNARLLVVCAADGVITQHVLPGDVRCVAISDRLIHPSRTSGEIVCSGIRNNTRHVFDLGVPHIVKPDSERGPYSQDIYPTDRLNSSTFGDDENESAPATCICVFGGLIVEGLESGQLSVIDRRAEKRWVVDLPRGWPVASVHPYRLPTDSLEVLRIGVCQVAAFRPLIAYEPLGNRIDSQSVCVRLFLDSDVVNVFDPMVWRSLPKILPVYLPCHFVRDGPVPCLVVQTVSDRIEFRRCVAGDSNVISLVLKEAVFDVWLKSFKCTPFLDTSTQDLNQTTSLRLECLTQPQRHQNTREAENLTGVVHSLSHTCEPHYHAQKLLEFKFEPSNGIQSTLEAIMSSPESFGREYGLSRVNFNDPEQVVESLVSEMARLGAPSLILDFIRRTAVGGHLRKTLEWIRKRLTEIPQKYFEVLESRSNADYGTMALGAELSILRSVCSALKSRDSESWSIIDATREECSNLLWLIEASKWIRSSESLWNNDDIETIDFLKIREHANRTMVSEKISGELKFECKVTPNGMTLHDAPQQNNSTKNVIIVTQATSDSPVQIRLDLTDLPPNTRFVVRWDNGFELSELTSTGIGNISQIIVTEKVTMFSKVEPMTIVPPTITVTCLDANIPEFRGTGTLQSCVLFIDQLYQAVQFDGIPESNELPLRIISRIIGDKRLWSNSSKQTDSISHWAAVLYYSLLNLREEAADAFAQWAEIPDSKRFILKARWYVDIGNLDLAMSTLSNASCSGISEHAIELLRGFAAQLASVEPRQLFQKYVAELWGLISHVVIGQSALNDADVCLVVFCCIRLGRLSTAHSLSSTNSRFDFFVRCCWRAISFGYLDAPNFLTLKLSLSQQQIVTASFLTDRPREGYYSRLQVLFLLHVKHHRFGQARKIHELLKNATGDINDEMARERILVHGEHAIPHHASLPSTIHFEALMSKTRSDNSNNNNNNNQPEHQTPMRGPVFGQSERSFEQSLFSPLGRNGLDYGAA